MSEDIDRDIAADLKDLFGSSKKKLEKTEDLPWDKEDAQDSVPADHLGPLPANDVARESSAFKFSFFRDTQESGMREGNSKMCKRCLEQSGKYWSRDLAQKI